MYDSGKHPVLWNDIFDARESISALYLWLLFGLLSPMVSCDLQSMIKHNPWARHFFGIVAFFLLFIVVNPKKNISIGKLWVKTIFIYLIFLLMTKSKWYFSVPLILLLLIDQSIKIYIENNSNAPEESLRLYLKIGKIMNALTFLIIFVGFAFYVFHQRKSFGEAFSWIKLLFYNTCKDL